MDAVSLAGTTGNAAEDYASCYMVPPTAGSYKFPCTLVDGTVLKGGVTAELKWAEEAGLVYDQHGVQLLIIWRNADSICW